jgi:hypothetical protein
MLQTSIDEYQNPEPTTVHSSLGHWSIPSQKKSSPQKQGKEVIGFKRSIPQEPE